MTKFVDAKGREWCVTLTAPVFYEIKRAFGVNLAKRTEWTKLATDTQLLVNCLWVICGGQHDVSDIEFGESLVGDVIANASEAAIGAWQQWKVSR